MKVIYIFVFFFLFSLSRTLADPQTYKVDWEGFNNVYFFKNKFLVYSDSIRNKSNEVLLLNQNLDAIRYGKHPFDYMFKICHYRGYYYAIGSTEFGHKIYSTEDLVIWREESLKLQELILEESFLLEDLSVYKGELYLLANGSYHGKLHSVVMRGLGLGSWDIDLITEGPFEVFGNSGDSLFLLGHSFDYVMQKDGDLWIPINPVVNYSSFYYDYRNTEGLFGLKHLLFLNNHFVILPGYHMSDEEKRFLLLTRDFNTVTELQVGYERLHPNLFFEYCDQLFAGSYEWTWFGRAKLSFYCLPRNGSPPELRFSEKVKYPFFIMSSGTQVYLYSSGRIYRLTADGFKRFINLANDS